MKKSEYRCPYCGSDVVLQDACLNMNTDEVHLYDDKSCGDCGREFYEALEAEVEVEDDEVLAFYAISGRICGEDEDTTLVVKASDREAALDEYRDQMMTINGLSESELEDLECNGEGLFINAVVMSRTPIVEV